MYLIQDFGFIPDVPVLLFQYLSVHTSSADSVPGIEPEKCLFDVQLSYYCQMWVFAEVFSQAELALNSKYLAGWDLGRAA